MDQMFSKLPMDDKIREYSGGGCLDDDGSIFGSSDVGSKGDFGALHCAAYKGNVPVATQLLDKGMTIDECSFDGATPLHVAASQDKTDMVSLLLERKADVNTQKVQEPRRQKFIPKMAGLPTHAVFVTKAKAHTETLSGPIEHCYLSKSRQTPLAMGNFSGTEMVSQYCCSGHRFAPLHLAVLLCSNSSDSLNGTTICFSRTFQKKIDDASYQAKNAGAKVSGTVMETTNILVCGSWVGAKEMEDAEKKGIDVLTEEEFT